MISQGENSPSTISSRGAPPFTLILSHLPNTEIVYAHTAADGTKSAYTTVLKGRLAGGAIDLMARTLDGFGRFRPSRVGLKSVHDDMLDEAGLSGYRIQVIRGSNDDGETGAEEFIFAWTRACRNWNGLCLEGDSALADRLYVIPHHADQAAFEEHGVIPANLTYRGCFVDEGEISAYRAGLTYCEGLSFHIASEEDRRLVLTVGNTEGGKRQAAVGFSTNGEKHAFMLGLLDGYGSASPLVIDNTHPQFEDVETHARYVGSRRG